MNEIAVRPDNQNLDLIQSAIANGASVEVMQALLSMKIENEQYEAKKAFTVALTDFRAKCPTIYKKNDGYNKQYKFAKLSDVVSQISNILSSCGLAVTWKTDTKDSGKIEVVCTLTHIDGYSQSSTLSGNPETSGNKNSIQAIGSTIEYLRRYTMDSLLGIATADEDNDAGNGRRKGNEPSQKVIDKSIVALKSCQTMEALQEAWAGLPSEAKKLKSIFDAKDEVKEFLESEAFNANSL